MLKKYIKNKFVLLFILSINFCLIGSGIFIDCNDQNGKFFVVIAKDYFMGNASTLVNKDVINDIKHIELYDYDSTYNEKFEVNNMFPGDSEIKYYCMKLPEKSDAKLLFSVDLVSDYKKIEDIFNLKIKLINDNKILYDGLIKNIPKTVDYNLNSNEVISEICYEITAYLDTSVGNEYQNKEVIFDYKWAIDDGKLDDKVNPTTGDNILFWLGLAIFFSVSLILLFLLILRNRRKKIK